MRRSAAAVAILSLAAPRALAQPIGAELRVNVVTTGSQDGPAPVALPGGDFVVAWASTQGDGDGFGISGRRFSGTTAAPLTGEFRMNTQTFQSQVTPSAAAHASGFVVVWQGGSTSFTIFGQRFDGAVSAVGTEFRVSSQTTGHARRPAVGASSATFVVAWNLQSTSAQFIGLFGQRYSTAGVPLGSEFPIQTADPADFASVSVNAAGTFVVVWQQTKNGAYWVLGRRFGSDGVPVGPAFRVDEETVNIAVQPRVAAKVDGSFVVVWNSYGYEAPTNVKARLFASSGQPLGADFQVNADTTSYTSDPAIAAEPGGGFVVVWKNAVDGGRIQGRRFSAAGAAVAQEFRVSTTPANALFPAVQVAAGANGFLTTWSNTMDGNATGLAGQMFAGGGAGGVPGDVDGSGVVNVSDILYLINFLFAGGPQPIGDADVNNANGVNVADILYLINYLFAGGPAPV